MQISIKEHLMTYLSGNNISVNNIQVPDATFDIENIKVIMINEVPPVNSLDYFYSKTEEPNYMKTTISLFHDADVNVSSIQDIINMGIYLTTAVKSPKSEYTVDTKKIIEHLPILEYEIKLFPNLKVIMLMGDVAKKAVNMISKKEMGRNVIPSASTYKIRNDEFYFGSIRVFPSYIMTGGNILIEKSKCHMISDDIRRMTQYVNNQQ